MKASTPTTPAACRPRWQASYDWQHIARLREMCTLFFARLSASAAPRP